MLVRVTNRKSGHQYNWPATLADGDPDLRIVDRPTCDREGAPVPPKFKAAAAAQENKADEEAQK